MPDDATTIADILIACGRVRRFLEGVERRAFEQAEEKHWAVASQLLLIGEAVNRLSPEFQADHPAIPWRRMTGMRNKLIHEYDRINWELVWRTATIEIPILEGELESPDDCT